MKNDDPQWLEDQYNNRARVPEHAQHFERWARRIHPDDAGRFLQHHAERTTQPARAGVLLRLQGQQARASR